MKLSIVILNWNAAADTICSVRQLLAWRVLQPEIWVVDNASDDDSVERIRHACPEIHLFCNETNQGFSGGNNRGIEGALAGGATRIILLNNDAKISEESVLKLVETLNLDETVGLAGTPLYDGEELISAGNKNPVLHHQTRVKELQTDNEITFVEAIPGTAILIRVEVFHSVGLLDEDYFFSTELADFCKRATLQGYHCAIHQGAKTFHHVERSSEFRSTLYTYYIIRNRFIYIRKFYQLLRVPLMAFWAAYTLLLAIKLCLAGQRGSATAVYLGLTDGLQGRFGGQNERILNATTQP